MKISIYCGISQSSVTEELRQEDQTIDKTEREAVIIDIAIPGYERVKDKEHEKVEKCQLLKDEGAKVWRMRKVIVVPVVIRALGTVSVNFGEYMKRISANMKLEVLQKRALLRTAKILEKRRPCKK